MDRSKKRDFLWKKPILYLSLFFAIGFFSGFLPSSLGILPLQIDPFQPADRLEIDDPGNRSSVHGLPAPIASPEAATVDRKKLLIVVTTTGPDDRLWGPMLQRLGRTLRLVPPPLLWIVAGARSRAVETEAMLRMTGVMFRQIVASEENFTEAGAEEQQRRLALKHIQSRRLDGIVHFAGLSNVYDLRLFEQIRETKVFATWLVASVSANKQATIEGPICKSSKVLGWHVNKTQRRRRMLRPRIGISSFAFNSSILWVRKSWSSRRSQDIHKFVREAVAEDESNILAFPPDCSRVLLWRLVPSR